MPLTQRALRTGTLPVLASAFALWSGCAYVGWHEGGDMASNDKHVYISTAWQPKTVMLLDTRSGETIASWHVPVGKQLAMQFYDDQNKDDAVMPTILRWEIMTAGRTGGTLSNSMPTPGRDARRLDWKLRPVPEYPPEEGEKNAAAPTSSSSDF